MSNKKIPIVMLMTALGQGAVALCLPSLPAIAQQLNATPGLTKDLISLFFLGFGVSQFIYGPLSARYGRKPILFWGMLIFNVGALLAVFCHSIDQLLLMRLLQGLGAGALMTSSRAILRDCYEGKKFTQAASYLSMSFALGLGILPLVGGYLQHYFNWQATFVFLFVVGLLLSVIIQCFLPETLSREKDHLSLAYYSCEVAQRYKEIILNTKFLRYLLGGVLAYGVVIAYSIMTPFLIQKNLHCSAAFFGWMTTIIAVFYYLGAYLNKGLVGKLGTAMMMKLGLGIIIASALFIIASSVVMPLNIFIIMCPLIAATIGQTFIFSNCIAGALQKIGV